MTTAAERLVINMARKWAARPAVPETATDLLHAVQLLEGQHGAGEPVETIIPWGQVVIGDQVMGNRNGKWYTVERTVTSNSMVRVWLEGVPDPLKDRPITDTVKVRRSEMGEAVDMFAAVQWSGKEGKP